MDFAEGLSRQLAPITVLPRRLVLETPDVHATVPMLRGVWGAALHELDADVYEEVFDSGGQGPASPPPAYVLRPAPADPELAPAVDYLLFAQAVCHDAVLLRAWDIASGMGLGKQRERFYVRRFLFIRPDGTLEERNGEQTAWDLSRAGWPLEGTPETTPCRLVFPAPLRLLRHGRLIEAPAVPDIAVAAHRRIGSFLPADVSAKWKEQQTEILEAARATPSRPWQGERLDLVRYSGRQQRELTMHGVTGSLELPDGPGPLWPLLAAAQWLHIGKGTTVGLGELRIEGLS